MRSIRSLIYAFLFTVAVQVATAQIKILYGPYLQNVKENEATIAWEADEPSIGWVELAPDDGTHYYGEERTKYFDTTNGVKSLFKFCSTFFWEFFLSMFFCFYKEHSGLCDE